MTKQTDEIITELLTLAKNKDDKKILACAEAFRLAEKYQVEKAVIGRLCNQENIKLYQCQLGCF